MDGRGSARAAVSSRFPPVATFVESLPIAIVETDGGRHIKTCNAAFERLLQWSGAELAGQHFEEVMGLSRDESARLAARLAAGERVKGLRAAPRCKNGSRIAVEVEIIPYCAPCLVGACCIVTAGAQHPLRVAEAKFARAFRAAPVAMALSTAGENRYIDVNDLWVRFTGYDREDAIGRTPLELDLYEDASAFSRMSEDLSQSGSVRNVEFRIRRRDGRRLIGSVSAEEFAVDGEGIRLVMTVDLTELRRAQHSLAHMARQASDAHERERDRMAAELHDDIGQRVAVLGFSIERVKQQAANDPALVAELEGVSGEVLELSQAVRALSHALHSPTVDLLSLDAAVRGLCDQVARQSNISVEFTHTTQGGRSMGALVDPLLTLGVYRVVQEALTNALKHSGTVRIDVGLWETSRAISLKVRDYGRGFDVSSEEVRAGLGLLSMRERVESLNGLFKVFSAPGTGTTLFARVSLSGSVAASPAAAPETV